MREIKKKVLFGVRSTFRNGIASLTVFARLLLMVGTLSDRANAELPNIWFAPLDPIVRSFNGAHGPADYFGLFSPESPWSVASSHIKVLKLYPDLAVRGPEAELAGMFRDLRRRGIEVALEFGAMTDTELCGRAVEGYNGERLGYVAARIKRLGGDIRYFAMDEPLWYGMHFNGKNACHSEIDAIARDVSANIKALKAVFPSVLVGDIEPVPTTQAAGWNSELAQWTTAYEREAGEKFAFFHVDVLWNQPWKRWIDGLRSFLHADGIPFGVIYNGDATETSDAGWRRHTVAHYREFEATYEWRPDQVVFQSWTNYPGQLLPETTPGTMTWMIMDYVKSVERR